MLAIIIATEQHRSNLPSESSHASGFLEEPQSINIVTLKTKNMLNSNTLSTGNPSQLTQLVGLQNEVPQFKYLQNEATLQHEVPQLDYLQHEANQLVNLKLT